MPLDINRLGDDGKRIFKEWKTKVEKHNKYTVRGKYFKERRMDEWQKELAEINNHYRKILKEMENKKKKEMKELEKAVKEAEKAAKEASPKKASAKKTGRSRCPRGTHRNKKTGNCEKKSAQTRKRCPNGTRRNKKTGNCE